MKTTKTGAGVTAVRVAVSRMTYPLRSAQRKVRESCKGRIRFTRCRNPRCAATA